MVLIQGLLQRPALNGLISVVQGPSDSPGRLVVGKLDGSDATMSLKLENLRLVVPVEERSDL